MSHRVKGSLFVDYVRMLRSQKTTDWSRYLEPEDLSFLVQRIQLGDWYPMATFERMGIAILREIAQGDLGSARAWGRAQVEWLSQLHEGLIVTGDACESLARFQVLRNSFFDYPAVRISHASEGESAVQVRYEMSAVAEEAATLQTMGFFERMLEMTGARDVRAWFSAEAWSGAPASVIELRWEP